MLTYITVDVIDRPSGGAVSALWSLGRAARGEPPPGCAAVIPCATAHLRPAPLPFFTPRRVALVAVWNDPEVVTAELARVLGAMSDGAREHWHVRGELARATSGDSVVSVRR